ncbi:diaminopimelate epimerase [Streptomyces roseochromogenus]|uniref:Diaminopimelate epimerase n=1 Tax=Streptomyces roseochromogenus subsp. oscitans DS 12.976 TaxID=1352936 RepID=V6JM49_STRRC|nr:diaminopimelate epimerase [Streptomyces roseochromogenus]EST17934.1 hypothetical protein M878_46270 [Streptomyces roseochromogenus subsp. oscitans DS 12.976]
MNTSTQTVSVPFAKGHGCANSFIVLPDPHGRFRLNEATICSLADPHTGVGADGILRAVRCAAEPEAAAMADRAEWFMDYRNADGTPGSMCGNGIRVLARYLVDTGRCTPGSFAIATRAGIRHVYVPDRSHGLRGTVTVAMGIPAFPGPDDITVTTSGGKSWPATHVDVGNPHAVVFVDALADAGDLSIPPAVEPAGAYPFGVTIEVAVVLGTDHLALRVHERGVGETRACGTGACAAVAAHRHHTGQSDAADYRVDLPGGTLHVSVAADGAMTLTGPAVITTVGTIRLPHAGETCD